MIVEIVAMIIYMMAEGENKSIKNAYLFWLLKTRNIIWIENKFSDPIYYLFVLLIIKADKRINPMIQLQELRIPMNTSG